MKRISCPNENEVRELIARGQWPVACPPELRAHVTGCRTCGNLVLISEAFREARAESVAAARPVPASILLWRAQLRRRNAAAERLNRPLLGAQIFALGVFLLGAVGFTGFEVQNGAAWLTWGYWSDWLARLPQAAASQLMSLSADSLTGSAWNWMVLLPAIATLLLVGAVAVYFATDKQ